MVDEIEIEVRNGINNTVNYIIYPKDNVCYINEETYYISDEQINYLLSIIVTWKYEHGTSNSIDTVEFEVKIYSDDKIDRYHGKGIFPYNYNEFKEVLGEVTNE